MAGLVIPTHHPPPGIYRLARAMRRLGGVVLALLLIYAATVAYSAEQVATSSQQSHSLSAQFAPNGTIEVTGSLTLSNPGIYPIQAFELLGRISNGTGVFLGQMHVGPTTIASGTTGVFPIAISLPISSSGPAASLLTVDQTLVVRAWANATYAYLFPLSVSLFENRSWGAPFEGFRATPGAPVPQGAGMAIPVTIVFSNHASSADQGTLIIGIESAGFTTCGTDTLDLAVASGDSYDQTQDVTLASGCSPAGGQLLVTYATPSGTVAFPPEAIP